MFLGVGLPAIIVGVVAWFYLADSPAKTKWLTPAEKDWLTGELTAEDAVEDQRSREAPQRPRRCSGTAASGCCRSSTSASSTASTRWPSSCPTIIGGFQAQFGVNFDYLQKGCITAIPYLPAAIALYFVTRNATKHGVKPGHIVIPALVGAVSIPLALYAGSARP